MLCVLIWKSFHLCVLRNNLNPIYSCFYHVLFYNHFIGVFELYVWFSVRLPDLFVLLELLTWVKVFVEVSLNALPV